MREQALIYAGLAAFLGMITFPAWYNAAAGRTAKAPEIRLPAAEKQCVAPTDYMKKSHMDLLLAWREEVVRGRTRTFIAFNGRTHEMSLTRTCLSGCHDNKAEFCDRCHQYVGVVGPYCMDCHADPRQARAARSRP